MLRAAQGGYLLYILFFLLNVDPLVLTNKS